jgi:hypothetical protein
VNLIIHSRDTEVDENAQRKADEGAITIVRMELGEVRLGLALFSSDGMQNNDSQSPGPAPIE